MVFMNMHDPLLYNADLAPVDTLGNCEWDGKRAAMHRELCEIQTWSGWHHT